MNVVSAIVEAIAVIVGVALAAVVLIGVTTVALPIVIVLAAVGIIAIYFLDRKDEHRAG